DQLKSAAANLVARLSGHTGNFSIQFSLGHSQLSRGLRNTKQKHEAKACCAERARSERQFTPDRGTSSPGHESSRKSDCEQTAEPAASQCASSQATSAASASLRRGNGPRSGPPTGERSAVH